MKSSNHHCSWLNLCGESMYKLQFTEQSHHPQNLFMFSFYRVPSSPPQHIHHCSVLYHYRVVFLRMSYKWNHRVCNLLRLTFFTKQNAFEMHPSFVCINCFFLFTAEMFSVPLYEGTLHGVFIQSPTEGHLGYFQLLVITNRASVNIHVQDFMWTYVFGSLGKLSKNRIAGSYGKYMFNFIRNCRTLFQSGCTILYSSYFTFSPTLDIIRVFF